MSEIVSEAVLSRLRDFGTPALTAMRLSRGRWKPAPHLIHLSTLLSDAVLGNGSDRLLVDMPPRHGKSVMCSHYFPVWFLEWFPEKTIVVASYAKDFAAKWGRLVRNTIDEFGDVLTVRLSADSKSVGQWHTQAGGGMICVGVGGALTGHGADVLLVDDPIKSRKEASSPTIRKTIHDWWKSTAYTRLEPGAVAVVIQARWHADDLIGRLKDVQEQDERDLAEGVGEDSFDRWEHISFPATCKEEGDVLGRAPPGIAEDGTPVAGEPLWPARWSAKRLARKRKAVGPFEWAALFQGHPRPPGDKMFRTSWFRYARRIQVGRAAHFELHAEEANVKRVPVTACHWFQCVDTALEVGAANDYTVIGTFARTPERDLIVVEIARDRVVVPKQLQFILARRKAWPLVRSTSIEKKQSGHGILQAAKLLGIPLRTLEADTSKVTRATPASILYENGAVYHMEGAPWIADVEAELLGFPNARHDDCVDVIAYASQKIRRGAAEALKVLTG